MRYFRKLTYLLLIIVLQTTWFKSLSVGGTFPDLILISVIIYSIIYDKTEALYFALLAGFFQDVLAGGAYVNLLTKSLVCVSIGIIKENFLGSEKFLLPSLVLIFSLLAVLLEGLIAYLLNGNIVYYPFVISMGVAAVYNLFLTPLLLPAVKRI